MSGDFTFGILSGDFSGFLGTLLRLSEEIKQLLCGDGNLPLEFTAAQVSSPKSHLKPLRLIDKHIALILRKRLLHHFDTLIACMQILLEPYQSILEISLLLELQFGCPPQLVISLADLLEKGDVLITNFRHPLLRCFQLCRQNLAFGPVFQTSRALSVPIVQYPKRIEVNLLKILMFVGLKFDKRLDVALDLAHHKIQLLCVFDRPLVLALPVSLPYALQQLKVVRLIAHHFLFLLRLRLAFEPDQR